MKVKKRRRCSDLQHVDNNQHRQTDCLTVTQTNHRGAAVHQQVLGLICSVDLCTWLGTWPIWYSTHYQPTSVGHREDVTCLKDAVVTVRRCGLRCWAVGCSAADDGVESVVHTVLMFPQQLHYGVVRAAEEGVKGQRSDHSTFISKTSNYNQPMN